MNTHQKYQTIAHHHFDFLYPSEADGEAEYPSSGLMLVQCANGKWFVQQEFGDEYGRFAGVVKSCSDLETVPTLYDDVDDAAKAAFELIRQVYPTTPDSCWRGFWRLDGVVLVEKSPVTTKNTLFAKID